MTPKRKPTKPKRVKPREWWGLIQYGDKGSVLTFRTKAGAISMMNDWNTRYAKTWTLIHLREVTDELEL